MHSSSSGPYVCASIVSALIFMSSFATAADAPTASVHRLPADHEIRGIPDEAVWSEIPEIGPFVQSVPRSGDRPTEATHVWIAYTKDMLYIAARCEDHEIDKIVAKNMGRDSSFGEDDRLEIVLDTFHDRRNAYYFATNPVGVLVDGRISENQEPAVEWDGIWNVRTHIAEGGWTAEFGIPFKTLGFNPDVASWGFNISRYLGRLRETSRWASPSFDVELHNLAKAGEITGLEGLSQGVGLDVRPQGILGFKRDFMDSNNSKVLRSGSVDIFYRIASNLVSSTTFNPDFAEAEADARQVNLTRFPLFYPEKRAFFLEDAGTFEFLDPGSMSTMLGRPPFIPFYSRNVGLVSGKEVPIIAGEKLTGKIGRFELGLMDVQTGDSEEVGASGKNLAVGRLKTKFWRESYAGAIFTNGDPAGKVSNQLGGLDLKLSTSNFLNRGKNLNVVLFAAKTNTSRVQGRENAYGGAIYYPNDFLFGEYRWARVDGNFTPSLGFVPRKGIRQSATRIALQPRPGFWGIRQMRFEVIYNHFQDLEQRATQSRHLEFTPWEMLFDSGERVAYRVRFLTEQLFMPWQIQPGIILPAGKYEYTTHNLFFYSSAKRPVYVNVSYGPGSFYSGTTNPLNISLIWKKNQHLTTTVSANQNWVRLKEGRFVTRIITFRLDYSFTPFISLVNFLQYDTDSRDLGLQSRLRWIVKPGNELWIVLNHNWHENPLDRFEAAETNFRVKLNYTFRF